MKHTLLLADNERSVRRNCKTELAAQGYRVLLAADGDEALEVVETFAVDLVVLDQHMPCCSGLEAARRIKQGRPQVPVILFTVDPHYEYFTSSEVDATVVKSGDLAALVAAVEELLAPRRAAAGCGH